MDDTIDDASELGVDQIASSPTLSAWVIVGHSSGGFSSNAQFTHSGSTHLLPESNVHDTVMELITSPSSTQVIPSCSHPGNYQSVAFTKGFHLSCIIIFILANSIIYIFSSS